MYMTGLVLYLSVVLLGCSNSIFTGMTYQMKNCCPWTCRIIQMGDLLCSHMGQSCVRIDVFLCAAQLFLLARWRRMHMQINLYHILYFIIFCCHIMRTHALGDCEHSQSVDIQSEIILNSQPVALALVSSLRQSAKIWLRLRTPLRGCETLRQWV